MKNLVLLLKKINGFYRFIKFNSIDDESLKNAVPYIKLSKYPEGSYIFRQGEITKEFFGIIKGRISIRVKKENYEKTFQKLIKNRKLFEVRALSN